MSQLRNPFEYDAAINLSDEMIAQYYIEDFNYSRFIQSTRNIFLVGDRGSGKTMTLLYNRWRVQRLRPEVSRRTLEPEFLGVYVPCNTPLVHKVDHKLLGSFAAEVLSEHFLVLSVAYAIADTLDQLQESFPTKEASTLRSELNYILAVRLPSRVPLFAALKQFVQHELLLTQRSINSRISPLSPARPYKNTFTFASLVVPLLNCLRRIPTLAKTHFMLMIDDAHDLNVHQQEAVNSWIAYRDHSLFSFKVATARFSESGFKTASGGSILEGHDFVRLDMVQPFQNELSDFGRLAEKLVSCRLELVGIKIAPEEFFPINEELDAAIEEAGNVVRAKAIEKYGVGQTRKISDYVYKYKRAEYFRTRASTANRPAFSGFQTLVFLSTGVIRNLLQPCYRMFDKAVSLAAEENREIAAIRFVPPSVQADVILFLSRRMWDWLEHELDKNICSSLEAARCFSLMKRLAEHFRARLKKHRSEPSANSFTISQQHSPALTHLEPLLRILREAQILYVRSGSAKEAGLRETYYVPNRMLWPNCGLDPYGQHARVSLRAEDLWKAAKDDMRIPLKEEPVDSGGLYDDHK